jgi:hypothetical protein
MSMTSTKRFSTKNAGILIVAVFSLVVSLGLSQVSSVMAQNELSNCDTKGADESEYVDKKVATQCNYEASNDSEKSGDNTEKNDAASTNDNENNDESSGVKSKTNSILTTGPAIASSDDNIIKPINLNKGTESDEPLQTNNDNNNQATKSESKQIFEDEMDLRDQLDTNTNTDVSEFYESFDLPYTAIYKNQ